jgi:hypothetical protein
VEEKIWAFINSPFGLMFIGTFMVPIMTLVMKKLLEKSPTLQELYHTYKGPLYDAVKSAEKLIPDDTENTGLQRLDRALKYLIFLQPKLAKEDPNKLKALLSQAHADIAVEDEKKEKLK